MWDLCPNSIGDGIGQWQNSPIRYCYITDVQPVELDCVSQLSSPPENCTFDGDMPNKSDEVIDIAIINTGTEEIQFDSGNFATLAITEVSN